LNNVARTANKGFCTTGADGITIGCKSLLHSSGLDGILLYFYLLTCTFIFLLGFSAGPDKQQFPSGANPWSLAVIGSDTEKNSRQYEKSNYYSRDFKNSKELA